MGEAPRVFLRYGETACTLRGTGACPPGKREGGLLELLTVLAVILKEKLPA